MAAARMAVRPAHTLRARGEVIAAGFAEGYFDVTFVAAVRKASMAR
jgi:hypothetical protein